MKKTFEEKVDKKLEERRAYAKKILWIGVIIVAIAAGVFLAGMVHATTQPVNFNLQIYSNGSVYTIQVIPTFNMTQNGTVQVVSLVTGSILYNHNFTGSLTFSIPIFYNSSINIYYGGNLITSKLITISSPHSAQSQPATPTLFEIVAIILPFVIIIIYDRLLSYKLENREKAPLTYEEHSLGADVNDALILERMGVITKKELEWMLRLYDQMRKDGTIKSINEMLEGALTEDEKRLIEDFKKVKEVKGDKR